MASRSHCVITIENPGNLISITDNVRIIVMKCKWDSDLFCLVDASNDENFCLLKLINLAEKPTYNRFVDLKTPNTRRLIVKRLQVRSSNQSVNSDLDIVFDNVSTNNRATQSKFQNIWINDTACMRSRGTDIFIFIYWMHVSVRYAQWNAHFFGGFDFCIH